MRKLSPRISPLIYAAAALVCLSAVSSVAQPANSIKEIQEIYVEGPNLPEVHGLAQTRDKGYLLAGVYVTRPWAVRLDRRGNVKWRYTLPRDQDAPPGGSAYHGVVVLNDDSALLCGYRESGDPGTQTYGLLTRITRSGELIDHRSLLAAGDKASRLNYLYSCSPWGDGFVVSGRSKTGYGDSYSYWLLALDGKGNVRWEKVFPNASADAQDRPIVLSTDRLVVPLWRGYCEAVLVGRNGEIRGQRSLGDAWLVQSVAAQRTVYLLSGPGVSRIGPFTDERNGAELRTLDQDLNEISRVSGKAELMGWFRSYVLPDQSLVTFGSERERKNLTATIWRTSADLDRTEKLVFQPPLLTFKVSAVVPLDRRGLFATARTIRSLPDWYPDEKRDGVIVSIIRIH